MKVLLNKAGLVSDFALIGDLIDGIEVPEPEDVEYFTEHYSAFRISDGVLRCDAELAATVDLETEKTHLRQLRDHECFAVINRGQLWYETLSIPQVVELRRWYRDWLKVTETKVVPERPSWLV